MRDTNFYKQAEAVAKRLKFYECDGQMSIFDMEWGMGQDQDTNIPKELEEPDLPW